MFSAVPAATFAFQAIASNQDTTKPFFDVTYPYSAYPYTLLRADTGTMETFAGFSQTLALAGGDPTKITFKIGGTSAADPPALSMTFFDNGVVSGLVQERFSKVSGDVNTITFFLSGSPIAVGTLNSLEFTVDRHARVTGAGEIQLTAAGGNNHTFFNEFMTLTNGTGVMKFDLGTFLGGGAPTSYGPDAQQFDSTGSFVKTVAVNQAPVGKANTVTAFENTPYVFQTTNFGFSDPNDTPPNSLLAVKVTTSPVLGSLRDNGVAVTAGTIVRVADIVAGKLKFTPATYGLGATYASFTFQVQDNGGTASGGINTDLTPRKMTLAVTANNQAPSGTTKTVSTLENMAYKIAAADFGFNDPHNTPANNLAAVKITTLPSAGTLKDNGTAVTVGQFVSVVDINAGKLVFTPAAYLSGGPYFLCKFQVQDSGGTANGGVNLDPSPKVLSIKITHVNQPPAGTAKTLTTPVNAPYVFKVADFGLTDSYDTPPNALFAVKITTLPVLGKLTDNGVAVVAGARISVADIMANKLKFTPVKSGRGTAYASFTFQVQDNGGTANSGIDLDPTPRKMTLNVA